MPLTLIFFILREHPTSEWNMFSKDVVMILKKAYERFITRLRQSSLPTAHQLACLIVSLCLFDSCMYSTGPSNFRPAGEGGVSWAMDLRPSRPSRPTVKMWPLFSLPVILSYVPRQSNHTSYNVASVRLPASSSVHPQGFQQSHHSLASAFGDIKKFANIGTKGSMMVIWLQ